MELYKEKRILTVTGLTHLIRGVLEENFEHVWVEGEVSNLAMPASGHIYFTLKDSGAQIRCVLFRASSRALRFRVANGMGLVLRGRVSVYDQRGEYQFIAEYVEPKGVGALQLAFAQLKEKLAKEGLFDEARKRPIPALPRVLGIVTSVSGAAVHDILTVLRRRHACVDVQILPVKVQGEGAAEELAQAVLDFNRLREADVLIVGRGGGSVEDLWAFNEEVVARAIHASRIPVISAVGHEVDFTIADFVADLRAPTPSAAAEMVVKSREELDLRISHLAKRLDLAAERGLSGARGAVEALVRALKDPTLFVGHMRQRVDELAERLAAGVRRHHSLRRERLMSRFHRLRIMTPELQVERFRERLLTLSATMESAARRILDSSRESAAVSAARLSALSPLATLDRGYCIARLLPSGETIRDGGLLQHGDRLDLAFRRGAARCVVESSEIEP